MVFRGLTFSSNSFLTAFSLISRGSLVLISFHTAPSTTTATPLVLPRTFTLFLSLVQSLFPLASCSVLSLFLCFAVFLSVSLLLSGFRYYFNSLKLFLTLASSFLLSLLSLSESASPLILVTLVVFFLAVSQFLTLLFFLAAAVLAFCFHFWFFVILLFLAFCFHFWFFSRRTVTVMLTLALFYVFFLAVCDSCRVHRWLLRCCDLFCVLSVLSSVFRCYSFNFASLVAFSFFVFLFIDSFVVFLSQFPNSRHFLTVSLSLTVICFSLSQHFLILSLLLLSGSRCGGREERIIGRGSGC